MVIRVDGVINEGKLQERKQTSYPATSKHLRPTLPGAAAREKAEPVPTRLEPEITGSLPFG